MFFSKKKKTDKQKALRTAEYIYSSNFRGTKRRKLISYGSDTASIGIKNLAINNPAHKTNKDEPKYIFDFTNKKITVSEYLYDGGKYLQVFVDGKHIGSMFNWDKDDDYWNGLLDGKASLVHIKMEPVDIIGKQGKRLVTEERYEPYIFVKF